MDEQSKKEQKAKISFFLSRYFKLLNIAWLILVFVCGNIFLIWPKYKSTITSEEDGKSKLKSELQSYKKELMESEELIRAYRQVGENDLQKINLLLPSDNVSEELFPKLKEIVSNNGLILVSMGIEPEKEKTAIVQISEEEGESSNVKQDPAGAPAEIGAIKINLNISGADYFSMVKLLDSLEKSLRILNVENVTFDPSGGSLTLAMKAYYYKGN